jgi:hypothetical protein
MMTGVIVAVATVMTGAAIMVMIPTGWSTAMSAIAAAIAFHRTTTGTSKVRRATTGGWKGLRMISGLFREIIDATTTARFQVQSKPRGAIIIYFVIFLISNTEVSTVAWKFNINTVIVEISTGSEGISAVSNIATNLSSTFETLPVIAIFARWFAQVSIVRHIRPNRCIIRGR